MKIPLAEKIAELEGRICALELRATAAENALRSERRTVTMSSTEFLRRRDLEKARGHWREMWRHFDLMIKEVFKGEV